LERGGEAALRFPELVIGSIKALRQPVKTQCKKLFMLFSRTFLTNNLAIVVTHLFWRGAGGEASLRFAELVIGSIKPLRHTAKNPV